MVSKIVYKTFSQTTPISFQINHAVEILTINVNMETMNKGEPPLALVRSTGTKKRDEDGIPGSKQV